MNLILPVPTITLGPEYAIENNEAFETIDSHNHSSGFGVQIQPNGLNISSDLDFQSNRAFNLKSSKYTDQSASLTGASNASSVYSLGGDLYWTNGSGTAVQITSGGSVVSTPASVSGFQWDAISTSVTINPADTYVVMAVNTSAARTITLPPAASVVAGRIYFINDASNNSETNNITVLPDGTDTVALAASDLINSNGATKCYVGDGISNWSII